MGGYLCSDRLNGRVAGVLDLVIAGRRFEPCHGHFFAFLVFLGVAGVMFFGVVSVGQDR